MKDQPNAKFVRMVRYQWRKACLTTGTNMKLIEALHLAMIDISH